MKKPKVQQAIVPTHVQFKSQNRSVTDNFFVTPETAKSILELNTRNRPLDKEAVSEYTESLKNKEWVSNGIVAIAVSKTGVLLNGQHTLSAIIKSGRPILVTLFLGLDDAYMRYAEGKPRSSTAQFALWYHKGEITPKDISIYRGGLAMAKALIWAENGFGSLPSKRDCWKFYEPKIESLSTICKVASKQKFKSAGFRAAIFSYHQKDPISAMSFLEKIISGSGLGADSPLLMLREYLILQKSGGGQRIIEDYKKTLFALMKFHKGEKTIKSLGVKTVVDFV